MCCFKSCFFERLHPFLHPLTFFPSRFWLFSSSLTLFISSHFSLLQGTLFFLLSVSLALFHSLCICQREVHFIVLAAFCVINSTLTLAHKQINPGTLRHNFIKSSPVLSLLPSQASQAVCLCERLPVFANSLLVSPIILCLCLRFHSRVMTSF